MTTSRPTTAAKTTGTLRDEQKRFTRERLIDAALEVFAERGYAAATVEDITTAAGASRATFYLHFKSKADIVTDLLAKLLLPESDSIYEELHDHPDPSWPEVRDFVESTLTYWDRHRAALDVLKQSFANDRDEVGEFWSSALEATSSVLAHYLSHLRGVDEKTARVRAIILIALLDGVDFYRHLPGVELDHDAVIDTLADFWWAAFRARPPRPASSPGD
jgi:AcrR family transcriptional regulator